MTEEETRAREEFRRSPEAAILRLGLYMFLLWVLFLLFISWYAPNQATRMLKMLGFQAMGGRGAGISKGLIEDLPKWLVVALVFSLDMTIVLVFYPLIVFSHRYGLRRWLSKEAVVSTVSEARRGRRWVRRSGIVGLVFFVWFPLYMTGPLIGAVIGYFLRLRPWMNMAAVGTGTFAAAVCWAYVFDSLLGVVNEAYVRYVPAVIVGLVAAIWIATYLIRRGRQRQDLPDD